MLEETQDLTAFLMKGLTFHQQGQLADARALFEQVLLQQPNNFDALHLLGLIAKQCNQTDLAIDLFGKALEIYPNDAVANLNLGNVLSQKGRYEEAVVRYNKAIDIKPDDAQAFSNRGNALQELQCYEDAITSYKKAITLKPDYYPAHYNLGNALQHLKRHKEAIESYDTAIAIKPDYAIAYSNRGVALKNLKRYEEALESCREAISIKSDYFEAFSNNGAVLQDLKLYEDALESYNRAIAIKPDYFEAHSNRGNVLTEMKLFLEALESYDLAITIKPDYPDAHWNKSLILLRCGQFALGWTLYEWRWKVPSLELSIYSFAQPLWLGNEALLGKTILLHAEQGLGDTLQFCRYAQLVKSLGATVLLEVPQPLMGLLAGLPGVDVLIESGQPLPAFDYHCPLMSLPLAFKTDLTNIPYPTAYLQSNTSKLEAWSQRLGARTKPLVGLVWSGSTEHKNDHNRSLPLAELLQHLPDTFEYVSLQKEVRQSDQEALTASKLLHFCDELKDFTDTTALCACMDVVVSVDTSVAHLAGAMGKPTCVLLPYVPDWRWLLDREDSPWYASVKLYRQGEDRQWSAVLARLASEIAIAQTIAVLNRAVGK